ncbi:unnamed protein product [Allacma fusca]|uniref:Protein kinase domain-containing protein n=1 Tax=Allacma fusca TaxID=39272 RepID=A0A8J2LJS0_9HEXA|nr:unnamed protein product [Allacma fusca]
MKRLTRQISCILNSISAAGTNLKEIREKRPVVVKNLSPEEVEEFIFGTATQNPDQSENFDVENMAFKPEFRICEQDLIIGHFGVVHQGQYRDRDVAIKSCKPNADREYFKAFLKEVKVMAYLGEHESIVMFWGAVVDDLANGKCQAVIELSPFGNLNNHLRKLSEQSEESRYVYLLSDEEEPESSH